MTDRTVLSTPRPFVLAASHFEGILGIASEAVVCIDEEQRIVFFNRGGEKIFGYAAGEVIGRPLSLLLPEGQGRRHASEVRSFGEGAVDARRMGERGEISGRRKDGTVFPAEASISRLDVDGTRIYTAVLRDASDRKRAEGEVASLLEREREARAAAESATLARDEVLRILSHDLGNSLSAILINARVLLATLPDEEAMAAARERVAGIRDLARQMEMLRKDLVDVTRLEARALPLELDDHAPDALLLQVVTHMGPLAGEAGIRLSHRRGTKSPSLRVDEARILQVLSNLVGNALKFTPPGGRVELDAEVERGGVRFSVSDSGPGIAEEDLPYLFDRYWQAKHARRAGAGLGLAIAKGIVEAHGGTIGVRRSPEGGAHFHFLLPFSGPPPRQTGAGG